MDPLEKLKETLTGIKKELLDKFEEQAKASTAQGEAISGFDEKFKELEGNLDKRIEDTVEKMSKERKISLPGLKEELEKKKWNWSNVIRASLNGKWPEGSEFEREVIEQTAEKRSVNASSGETGGFLIPDEVTSKIIDLAIAKTPMLDMGPEIMRGLRGELPIPKITGRPTAYWVDEEEAPTESNTTFGSITLRPKTLGAFTKISRRVIHQTADVANRVVENELTKAFQLAINQGIISGKGSEKEPKGIILHDNIRSLTLAAGNRFRVDDAAAMITEVDEQDLLPPNARGGFAMHPRVLSGMKRERVVQFSGQAASAGMPVINPWVNTGTLEDILGYPIRTTTQLSKALNGIAANDTHVIFGDFSQLLVGFWEGFELRASDTAGNSGGSAMTQNQIWLVAFQGMDWLLQQEAAFAVLTDASAVETDW